MTFAMITPYLTLLIALLVFASFRFSSYPKTDLVLDSLSLPPNNLGLPLSIGG